jgi:hypothetical protein
LEPGVAIFTSFPGNKDHKSLNPCIGHEANIDLAELLWKKWLRETTLETRCMTILKDLEQRTQKGCVGKL